MNQLLIDLKNKLNPIAELIKDKNDVFYFDYPLHLNVGGFADLSRNRAIF